MNEWMNVSSVCNWLCKNAVTSCNYSLREYDPDNHTEKTE